MFRGIAGLLFLRLLPRRLLPVLTAWQVFQMIRNRRRRNRTNADAGATTARPRSHRR